MFIIPEPSLLSKIPLNINLMGIISVLKKLTNSLLTCLRSAFPCSLQALMLENLQKSSSHGGLQPNSQV